MWATLLFPEFFSPPLVTCIVSMWQWCSSQDARVLTSCVISSNMPPLWPILFYSDTCNPYWCQNKTTAVLWNSNRTNWNFSCDSSQKKKCMQHILSYKLTSLDILEFYTRNTLWAPGRLSPVKHLTLGFGSNHDLMVVGLSPALGSMLGMGPCLGFSLSLSLCLSPSLEKKEISFILYIFFPMFQAFI